MRKLAAASILVLAASASHAAPTRGAAAEVAGLLPGTYVSRDSGASLRFAVVAVPKNSRDGGTPVFYAEAAKSAAPYAPFFQRFLRLEEDGARVTVRVYEPRDLAGVRGKWREPDALALFSARDMRERPDCRMTLERVPAGVWTGGTAGATCFSAAANARLAVSMTLSPQTLGWREEGKDAAGSAVFGPFGEMTVYAREGALSSRVNEPAASAPPALVVTSLSSPSKKYSISELRGLAGAGRVSLEKLVEGPASGDVGAAVVVVTSSGGSVSVFSRAEITSPGGPSLDVGGASPRLVAAGGRGLEEVVSIELRVLR